MKLYKSGESHGRFMVGMLLNVPYGITADQNQINALLKERNLAFGRSERQKKERDKIFYLSGVANGKTIGNNVALIIKNNVRTLSVSLANSQQNQTVCAAFPLTNLRPGHADMAGMVKYGLNDVRVIAEGASARNTCLDVAAGAVALSMLSELNIGVTAIVRGLADQTDDLHYDFKDIRSVKAPYFSTNKSFIKRVRERINKAANEGESLGGEIEIRVSGIKAGFGNYIAEKRVNGVIARDLMQIQCVKGVYFGACEQDITLSGTQYLDGISYQNGSFSASGTASGGIDGGMTNGAEMVIRVKVKPLPTTKKGVCSVDVNGKPCLSQRERSDITAVFALCPILKSVLALTLSQVIVERTGGDSLSCIKERYQCL